MGIRALNPGATTRYVHPLDPGYREDGDHDKSATVWLIGTLDAQLMADLSDAATYVTDNAQLGMATAAGNFMAAKFGLRGWENFCADDGERVGFQSEKTFFRGREMKGVPDDLLRLIPAPVLQDIGRKAKEANSVSALEAKKSASASSPSNSSPSATAPDAPSA